jgi:hypothetical protein
MHIPVNHLLTSLLVGPVANTLSFWSPVWAKVKLVEGSRVKDTNSLRVDQGFAGDQNKPFCTSVLWSLIEASTGYRKHLTS